MGVLSSMCVKRTTCTFGAGTPGGVDVPVLLAEALDEGGVGTVGLDVTSPPTPASEGSTPPTPIPQPDGARPAVVSARASAASVLRFGRGEDGGTSEGRSLVMPH